MEKAMDFKFSKIVNREKRTAEMLLYGTLGDDQAKGEINGHYFARELNYLGRECDEIKIRINSDGGDVSHGLSIVSEMMASNAFIIAQVDGIAASMAAVLLPAADRVVMNDYAKVMIHSPYYVDENGEMMKNLSAKNKKALTVIKDTLAQLLGKRGIEADEIGTMLKTDTWFSSSEALTAKLVDEVITTGKMKQLAALEPMRLVAKINNEHNLIVMKKVIAKLNGFGLNLTEDATEDQMVAALDTFQPKTAEPSEKLVNSLIAVGKKAGVVTDGDEGNESKLRKLAKVDFDLFVDMLGIEKLGNAPAAPRTTARMSDLVANARNNAAAPATEKTFEWYEKNDPQALAKMEKFEPEKFAKLEAADKAQYES